MIQQLNIYILLQTQLRCGSNWFPRLGSVWKVLKAPSNHGKGSVKLVSCPQSDWPSQLTAVRSLAAGQKEPSMSGYVRPACH